jgi:hypothetical protein
MKETCNGVWIWIMKQREVISCGLNVEAVSDGRPLYRRGIKVEHSQSRQCARLSLHSPELGPPTPSPGGECCRLPLVPGGGHTRLRESEWADPIRKRG